MLSNTTNKMTKRANDKEKTEETMDFGPVYTQFEGKTKEAMIHLAPSRRESASMHSKETILGMWTLLGDNLMTQKQEKVDMASHIFLPTIVRNSRILILTP